MSELITSSTVRDIVFSLVIGTVFMPMHASAAARTPTRPHCGRPPPVAKRKSRNKRDITRCRGMPDIRL